MKSLRLISPKYSWFSLGGLVAILLILALNLWMVSCGHCSLSDFLRVPWIGWLLIVGNLLAAAALYFVHRHKRGTPENDHCCSCQVALRENWTYCPKCGAKR